MLKLAKSFEKTSFITDFLSNRFCHDVVLYLFVSPYTVWSGCIRQDKRHFRYSILFECVHTSTNVHCRKSYVCL